MAQYAIMRFSKQKDGMGALEAHHERTKAKYASNPDIDQGKSIYFICHYINGGEENEHRKTKRRNKGNPRPTAKVGKSTA